MRGRDDGRMGGRMGRGGGGRMDFQPPTPTRNNRFAGLGDGNSMRNNRGGYDNPRYGGPRGGYGGGGRMDFQPPTPTRNNRFAGLGGGDGMRNNRGGFDNARYGGYDNRGGMG